MTIHDILEELNETNSTNDKLAVLKKHKDNELLQKVFQMTYDKVKFTYGMSLKTLSNFLPNESHHAGNLVIALDVLEHTIASREATGHSACQIVANMIGSIRDEDAEIIKKIINRDLKVNVGRTQINKVWKGLITKPVYMRCGVFNEKTKKKVQKWKSPYMIQLKADGLAMFVTITTDDVICNTRAGEEFMLQSLQFLKLDDSIVNHVIQGEFLVAGIQNRAESNGMINSLIKYKQGNNHSLTQKKAAEIEESLIFQIWDMVTLEEYSQSVNKTKTHTPYSERFDKLLRCFG